MTIGGEDKAPGSDALVSVIDAASQLGMLKQTVFKILKRLGIEAVKHRDPERRNAPTSFITSEQLKRVVEECATSDGGDVTTAFDDVAVVWGDMGYFYVVQLEPEHDPGRFKLGFTVAVAERLRTHRCAAPFAEVLQTWPCRRVWERAAIDCASAGCEQLHTEVFRGESIEAVIERAEEFFALMPRIDDSAEDGEGDA